MSTFAGLIRSVKVRGNCDIVTGGINVCVKDLRSYELFLFKLKSSIFIQIVNRVCIGEWYILSSKFHNTRPHASLRIHGVLKLYIYFYNYYYHRFLWV